MGTRRRGRIDGDRKEIERIRRNKGREGVHHVLPHPFLPVNPVENNRSPLHTIASTEESLLPGMVSSCRSSLPSHCLHSSMEASDRDTARRGRSSQLENARQWMALGSSSTNLTRCTSIIFPATTTRGFCACAEHP